MFSHICVGHSDHSCGALKACYGVHSSVVTRSIDCVDSYRSVIEEIADGAEEVDLGGRSIAMRAYASWFNFKGADQQKSVGVLSGGERNRLQLAKVSSDPL